MEEHWLPQEVERLLQGNRGHTCLVNEKIAEFTELHCRLGKSQADTCRVWNLKYPNLHLSEQAASRYIRHFREHKTPFTTNKRGPKELLSEERSTAVTDVLLKIRSRGVPARLQGVFTHE